MPVNPKFAAALEMVTLSIVSVAEPEVIALRKLALAVAVDPVWAKDEVPPATVISIAPPAPPT